MHLRPVIIVLLLATALVLSGCLQVPEDDEGDPGADPGTDDDQQDGSDGDGDDGDGDGGPGDDDGDGGGDNGNTTDDEDKECHEHDPARPAHPEDHEVESLDEIRCPGQFTITDEGSGEHWEVPSWSVDDWWRYEIQISTTGYSECREIEQTVTGDDTTRFDLPVYSVVNSHYDCEGEAADRDEQEIELTQGHLMHISRNGYIEHNARFPFQEGKGWAYMGQGEDLVEIEDIEYDDGGALASGETWHVEWGREDESGTFHMDQTWSVDARNILEETITVTTESGVFQIEKKLLDSNYEFGGDGPVL